MAIKMLQETNLDSGDQAILVSQFAMNPNKATAFRSLLPGAARDLWIKLELELYKQNHMS
jgi:hypothetical protein